MKTNILSWLKSSGLDEQRANIFLALLSLGESTAKQISEKVKLGRTAVYDNLRILEEKGYAKSIRLGKRQKFVPTHPKELYKQYESKKTTVKRTASGFFGIIRRKKF
jgi:sugar-specific transcriptional regulator TrmB